MRKKIISAILSVTMLAGLVTAVPMTASAATAKEPQYQADSRKRPMEKLGRGLVAAYRTADSRSVMSADAGVYLSWRLLGKESLTNQAFDIYRSTAENGTFTKIGTSEADGPTNYIDKTGTMSNWYKVVQTGADSAAVAAEKAVQPTTNYTAKGNEVGSGNSHPNSFTYIDIPIERPDPVERMGDGKKSYYYTYDSKHEGGANDASVGDIDGDGEYEIILKWDPTDSKDSAGADFTGNCYIDAYEIDPTNNGSGNKDNHLYKWRIDLGKNVTSGAHYTQFIVYDFDNNGKAEIAMKTAPGTIDGTGHYVTEVGDTEEIRSMDNTKQYIGTSGVLKGKNPFTQFLTVFDGETGAALATTEYIPYEMHKSTDWGDITVNHKTKYNRSERYLAGVAYLDGVTPSIIMCRGYYNDAVIRAYNWDGQTLSMVWEHDGASKSATSMYGNGNHQLSISDIDDDGKDEIVYGSVALDDDGKNAMGNTFLGHGDAMHVSDFNNDGIQECFSVKEDGEGFKKYAEDLRVVSTGKHFWAEKKIVTTGDNGRGVMANVDDEYAKEHSNALALGWSSGLSMMHDLNGDDVAAKPASAGSGSFDNSLVYWDGDLSRELLDANIIQKYDAENGWTKRFYGPSDGYTLTGGSTNNYTKRNASLSADLWGDWREEIIMATGKGQNETPALRIFTSTIPTEYRLTTLMHDSQYRTAIAWQNVGYNQPPHQSYYIGSASLATDADGNTKKYLAPAVKFTNIMYPDEIPVIPVESLSIDKTTLNVEKTKSETIKATVLPENATKKNVTWRSSDEKVASVSNGTVTGINPGTATITAIAAGGEKTKTCEVTVWSKPVESITLNKEQMNISASQTEQLTATLNPSDASEKGITWRSSNPAVATVSDTGLVTTLSTGLATIYATAKDNGKEAACVVNIAPVASTDKTGTNIFETDNADSESNLSDSTATGASFKQENATVGGRFYRTFEKIDSDKKAKLSFKFETGGTKISNNTYNWDGHEFSFYVKLLDENENNILSLWQPFETKAGTLMNKAGNSSEAKFVDEWSAVKEGIGTVQGSWKRWLVDIEFDYDKKTANAVLQGYGNGWEADPTARYERTFSIPTDNEGNVLRLGKIEFSSTKDGTGTVYWEPKVESLSYQEVVPMTGASTTLLRRGERMGIPWSDTDINGWTQTGTDTAKLAYDSENKRIWYNPTKPGTSYSAKKTFDVTDGSTITYDVDWYFGGATNRFVNTEYIQLGSNLRLGWTTKNGKYYVLISTDGGNSYIGHTGQDADDAVTASNAIFSGGNEAYTKNINLVVNTATNKIKSFKFGGVDIGAVTELPSNTQYGEVSFGFARGGGTENWGYPNGIDNIMVSEFVQGETPKFNVQFVNDDGTVLKEEAMAVGTTPSYTDTPTKNGDAKYDTYTFKAWDKEFAPVVDDTVYTAQYTGSGPKSYTVTLNKYGGEISSGSDVTTYTYSDTTSVPLPTLTKTGYTFLGWFETEESTITEPVGTGVDDEVIEDESFREIAAGTTGDIVLHARWSPEVYDVTLSANGGTISSGDITSYSYGAAVPLPTAVTKKGSSFVGWYDNEELTGTAVTEIAANSTGAKTYYAKWDEAVYSVTLHLFGGTVDPVVTSYKYGDAITLATPTKSGFTFDGWYSNSTYHTKAGGIKATDSGNKNFYAKWTTAAPTIEFGSVGEDGKTVTAYFSSDKNTNVIIGVLYDGGAVKEIKTTDTNATKFAAYTVFAKDIKFDNDVNNYDLKLFLWDSIDGAKPLAATPGIHNKAAN